MNSVDLVKKICKERGIPISKLERDCDFSNGYIRRLKEGKFPSDRLLIISEYLDIPLKDLATGQVVESGYYLNEETAKMAQSIFEDKDLRILFDAAKDSSPDDLRMAADLLKRLKGTNPDA